MKKQYDIVIVGSGIGGSTLALALAKVGAKVLVIEKTSHPRFAIGESTTPPSTLVWKMLSYRYDIPEFLKFSHYLGMKEEGLTGWPKSAFWFGWHKEGKSLEHKHEIMFETLKLPVGPDVHMMRSEVDEYFVKHFPDYGIDYSDHTEFLDFNYDSESKWGTLKLKKDDQEFSVQCKLAMDAGGHGSLFAKKYNLQQNPPELKTNTRSIFGHFREMGKIEELYKHNKEFRTARDASTMHHCFEGGWIWVIPFDNGVTSMGIVLDRNKYPLNESISAEEEMDIIIKKFPDVARHFSSKVSIRKLIRTDRVQFRTNSIIGPGFVITPHAACFVDALFSTGLSFSAGFVNRFTPILEKALKDGNFDSERFRPVEKAFFAEVKHVDSLVSATIESFRDYDVMKQCIRFWATANMTQLFCIMFGDASNAEGSAMIFGAASEKWRKMLEEINEIVFDSSLSNEDAAKKMKAVNDSVPMPYDVANNEVNSKDACLYTLTMPNPGVFQFFYDSVSQLPEMKDDFSFARFTKNMARFQMENVSLRTRYTWSKLTGGELSKTIDKMFEIIAAKEYPGNEDFFGAFQDAWNGRFLSGKKL